MPVATVSVTGFGLRLLEQLGPVTFSPLSVHRALATFRQGAAGETREALDAVLGDDARELVVEDPAVPFDLHRDSGTLLFLGRVTDPSTT